MNVLGCSTPHRAAIAWGPVVVLLLLASSAGCFSTQDDAEPFIGWSGESYQPDKPQHLVTASLSAPETGRYVQQQCLTLQPCCSRKGAAAAARRSGECQQMNSSASPEQPIWLHSMTSFSPVTLYGSCCSRMSQNMATVAAVHWAWYTCA
jgi:hypothetical protein